MVTKGNFTITNPSSNFNLNVVRCFSDNYFLEFKNCNQVIKPGKSVVI